MNHDFLPNASIEVLRERAKILARVRQFFDSRDFFEVQTPILSRDTVVDQHIDPVAIPISVQGDPEVPFYLQTSPEFAMKRIMAAGASAIYQIGPAVRADEVGRHHNIEFTMLEWYRVADSYEAGMDLLDEFAQDLLGLPPAKRLTFYDAVHQYCGFDFNAMDALQTADKIREILGSEDLLETVLVEKIEPAMAKFPSLILYDWPANQAALARIRDTDRPGISQVAERFELYVAGHEIANGYHELTDADALCSRNRENNLARKRSGRVELPTESRLLDAMRYGLPECCGVALGIDRLMMLAMGKSTICEVMAFDSRRA
ncbi:MAG: EF-P lysine aminoacylase EpmA [Pirellulaceae bacterium]|nr:EF-P lysine aminoacylase EpmA [Pirellulaceae bacterium]